MSAHAAVDFLCPGKPHFRWATRDRTCANFARFFDSADRVELCWFDASEGNERARLTLREQTGQVLRGCLPRARPGLLLGHRAYGSCRPLGGHRLSGEKRLLDPCAHIFVGPLGGQGALFGDPAGGTQAKLPCGRHVGAPRLPRCKVVESAFNWGDDRSPTGLRGTCADLSCAPAINPVKPVGVFMVERMQVHSCIDDRRLAQRGLRGQWGCSANGNFALRVIPRWTRTRPIRPSIQASFYSGCPFACACAREHWPWAMSKAGRAGKTSGGRTWPRLRYS